jgi:hypothetical protein
LVIELVVIAVLVGVFWFGLWVFRGKIEMPSPRRPSPAYDRFFPKIFGGIWMLGGGYGMILLVLGASGLLHSNH